MMQVILMEKVANLGNLGDVVKVKDGYARNYLIPHGKAKRATEENLKTFETRRAELEKAQAEQLAKAQGVEVERSQVRMPSGPLKQVADYHIQIALHTDVIVTINVSVLGET